MNNLEDFKNLRKSIEEAIKSDDVFVLRFIINRLLKLIERTIT